MYSSHSLPPLSHAHIKYIRVMFQRDIQQDQANSKNRTDVVLHYSFYFCSSQNRTVITIQTTLKREEAILLFQKKSVGNEETQRLLQG